MLLPTLALAVHLSPALWFDGRQKVAVPDRPALHISKAITMEAWVWPAPDSKRLAFTFILSKNMNNTGYALVTIGREEKRVQATGWTPAMDVPGNPIPVGRWSHLAFVRDAKVARMYVNGRLAESMPTSSTALPNDLPLVVGFSPFANGDEPCGWIGAIKEVRIWNRARTQGQIRRTMDRRLTGRERGLVSYLPLDEGRGQIARDRARGGPSVFLGGAPAPDPEDPSWVKM